MWLWANVITTTWGGVPNGSLSMMFTCCPNLMFLASLWLEIYRFSNWLFCWLWAVQSWYLFCYLWASQNWPYLFPFTDFELVTAILLGLGELSGFQLVIRNSQLVFNFSQISFFDKLRKSQIKEKSNFKRRNYLLLAKY